MTRQEEIREGIAKYLKDKEACEIDWPWEFADGILSYLHSKGVVIKVDRELPENPHSLAVDQLPETRGAYKEAQQDMRKAGHVAVEPLIEGNKANREVGAINGMGGRIE